MSTLIDALKAIVESACSVPAPYAGNAIDPVNDLRIVSGRRIEEARQIIAEHERSGDKEAKAIELLQCMCHASSSDYPTDPGECGHCYAMGQFGMDRCSYHESAEFLRKHADGEI